MPIIFNNNSVTFISLLLCKLPKITISPKVFSTIRTPVQAVRIISYQTVYSRMPCISNDTFLYKFQIFSISASGTHLYTLGHLTIRKSAGSTTHSSKLCQFNLLLIHNASFSCQLRRLFFSYSITSFLIFTTIYHTNNHGSVTNNYTLQQKKIPPEDNF